MYEIINLQSLMNQNNNVNINSDLSKINSGYNFNSDLSNKVLGNILFNSTINLTMLIDSRIPQ